MASIPYFLRLQVVIAAGGGTGTATYLVPSQQTLHLNTIEWNSTGIFGIYNIRNTNGRIYTNASQAIPLNNTFFQQGSSPNIGLLNFSYALDVAGSDGIFFDIIDLSGAANTVNLLLTGSLDLGG